MKRKWTSHSLRWTSLMMGLLILPIPTCDKLGLCPNEDTVLYSTSFESAAQIQGWEGLSVEALANDPAPNWGERCLNIGGGCIQPTASITFPCLTSGGLYSLSCWGKVDEPFHGGRVILSVVDGPSAEININDREWTLHKSDKIYCPPECRLRIELMVGGFVADFMKIDGLQIIEP